jgi:hypothetical protein
VGLFKRIRNVARNVVGTVTGVKYASKVVQKATSKGPLAKVKQVVRKVAAIDQGIKTAGLIKPKLVGIKNPGSVAVFKQAAQVSQAVAVAAVTGQGVKGAVEAVAPVVVQSFTPAEAGEDFAWNPEGGGGGAESYGPRPAWPARPEAAAGNGGPSLLPIVGVGLGIYLLTKGG